MLLSGSIAFAHTDPIVMIINGQSVKKSEFEYFYQKNHLGNTVDSKSVKVFADGFVDYKLKVQAAKDAHLDTLPNIRRVLKRYHDSEACESMPDKGSVHVAHILLRLGQKASYQEQEIVKTKSIQFIRLFVKGLILPIWQRNILMIKDLLSMEELWHGLQKGKLYRLSKK